MNGVVRGRQDDLSTQQEVALFGTRFCRYLAFSEEITAFMLEKIY